MELTIDNKKFIFKEMLNYEEDAKVNLMSYIVPLMDKEKIDDKELLKMVLSTEFNEKGVILISLLSIDPKMKIDEVKKLPKPTVMKLMMECLKTYAQSYVSVFSEYKMDDTEKKRLGLPISIRQ